MSKPAAKRTTPKARRNGRFVRLGQMLPTAGPAKRRRGLAEARMITDWEAIMGEQMAAICQPERLAGRVLTVRVTPAAALELQYLAPKIIERITTFFGRPVVERLKLRQGEVTRPEAPRRHRPRELTEAENTELARSISEVEDEDLRDALERLGRAVMASGPAS